MARKLGVAAIVCFIAGALFWQGRHRAAPPAQSLAARTAIPHFSFTDVTGQPIDSDKLRGRVVLVDFWAMWCPPCEAEIPHFAAWQNHYGAQGLQVVGLSMDDAEPPVRSFVQQRKISYPIAMADEKTIAAFGGILGLPANILIDREGKLIVKHVGLTDMQSLQQEVERALAAK